jgi:uncharacterized protein
MKLNFIIVCLILLVFDYYFFRAAKAAFYSYTRIPRKTLKILFWVLSIASIIGVAYVTYLSAPRLTRTLVLVSFFILYFSKIIAFPFFIIDEIRRLGLWITKKVLYRNKAEKSPAFKEISRSEFLSKTALLAGAVPLSTLSFGVVKGVYDYHVRHVPLILPNLPSAFNGLKIAQISDVHSGSFTNKTSVMGGIEMLLAEKPDVIFFTGDLVNDRSEEMKDYMNLFDKLKAPLGTFSILGNHDYGDYVQWPSPESKQKNLEDLKRIHANLGWRLLLDEHIPLSVNNESIAVIGIENWGALSRFPKYGNLSKAAANTDDYPVKLLLSHDPSHWRAQVIPEFPQIDAMFAGHTHGMQFGIRTEHFQWSPVQFVYKEWAGLYQENQQQLYVNTGYGFLGYPGRVGIYPEITIFELSNKA